MAWLGVVTISILYWCFFTTIVTGRKEWIILCIWWVPVLSMTVSYREGMEINGLMVLICIFMFLLCRRSLLDVRMWNLKMRKKHSIIVTMLYLFCFMFWYYCVWQMQELGYFWDFQGLREERIDAVRLIVTSIPICLLAIPFTGMLYNSLDRIYCKKQELILLSCKFFTADENGMDRGLWKGYYLDGVHNGVNYHFRMTHNTFEMVKKEKNIKLQVHYGILGGLYVRDNPCPENAKKILKRERKSMKIGIALFLPVFVAAIWFFLVVTA